MVQGCAVARTCLNNLEHAHIIDILFQRKSSFFISKFVIGIDYRIYVTENLLSIIFRNLWKLNQRAFLKYGLRVHFQRLEVMQKYICTCVNLLACNFRHVNA